MPKDPSPLLGYNNNIRHKNRVFHVQTEDSGVKHPHIITHLFMDGGRILKSFKRSYAEHVGAEKMQDVVRQMMKEQHKAMLIALRDGQFDHLLEPTEGRTAPAPPPTMASETSEVMPLNRRKDASAHAPTVPHLATPARKSSAPGMRSPAPTIPDGDEAPATSRTGTHGAAGPQDELTLDIDALERAAAEATASPAFEPQSDLPPPPANVLRGKPAAAGGSYRAVPSAPPDHVHPSSRPPSRPPSQPPASRHPPPLSSRPPRRGAVQRVDPRAEPPSSSSMKAARPTPNRGGAEGRYAPARPAAIFGQARPKRGNSIFGEDLISDKSLDEVILSYLAEDLEPGAEKKRK